MWGLALVLTLLYRARNERIIRDRPDAVCEFSISYRSLTRAFGRLASAEQKSIALPPYLIALVADFQGIEVWGGLFAPRRYCAFPWSVVVEMRAESIDHAHFRGVVVAIRTGSEAVIDLPFILLGMPRLIFSYSPRQLNVVVERMRALAPTSA